MPRVGIRAGKPVGIALAIGLVLLLGAGCSQADATRTDASTRSASPTQSTEPAGQPRATLPRIVFLGDSLTAGYGIGKQQAVPALIQAHLDANGYHYEVVNAGVSGDTSAGGLSRLEWSLDGQVAILVIELGANDGLRGLPVAQMKDNLEQIITRAKRRGITVIFTGMEAPPNYGAAYTSEFRQAFRDLAKAHDVIFVPFYLEGVAGNPNFNIPDGIHPNAAGSKIIERTIWRALEPVLDKQD